MSTVNKEKLYKKIIQTLENDGEVFFSTIYRHTKLLKKHIKLLTLKNNRIYIKKIDYTDTRITTRERISS